MSRFWYYYISGDETVPSRYSRIQENPNPDNQCPNGSVVCAIYAPPNGLNPQIPATVSSTIQSYLAATRTAGGVPWPQNNGTTEFQKPYVYLRS